MADLDPAALVKAREQFLIKHPQQAAEVQRMTALLRREQELAGDTQPLNSATPQPAEFDFSRARRKGRARAGE